MSCRWDAKPSHDDLPTRPPLASSSPSQWHHGGGSLLAVAAPARAAETRTLALAVPVPAAAAGNPLAKPLALPVPSPDGGLEGRSATGSEGTESEAPWAGRLQAHAIASGNSDPSSESDPGPNRGPLALAASESASGACGLGRGTARDTAALPVPVAEALAGGASTSLWAVAESPSAPRTPPEASASTAPGRLVGPGSSQENPLPLVVVGAGPHALALVLRLHEELLHGDADADLTPADLQRRDYW